jgi:hypothetical protein
MPYIPTENHLPKKDVGKFREWEFCRNSTHTLPHHHHHLRSPHSTTLTTQRRLTVTMHAVITVHSKSIHIVPLFSFDTISRCHVAAPATWQRSFVFHNEQHQENHFYPGTNMFVSFFPGFHKASQDVLGQPELS